MSAYLYHGNEPSNICFELIIESLRYLCLTIPFLPNKIICNINLNCNKKNVASSLYDNSTKFDFWVFFLQQCS